MEATGYLLPRPPLELSPAKQNAFEALWNSRLEGSFSEYPLPYPKWQFLSYLCETRELVLHGSQNRGIHTVEPRQANDVRAFSDQHAIYATTDGIWVIFFAILKRAEHPNMTLFNTCLRARTAPDALSDPLYFFSITGSVLNEGPWCDGMVYILPRGSFSMEPSQRMQGMEIVFPHWISTVPVEPAARLQVGPQDFPFLAQIHGHNNGKLAQMAAADPAGFPWPEALES
ncbi:MAG TPA: hypothetical protein VIV15_17160 [Anaerolineales bacterium]